MTGEYAFERRSRNTSHSYFVITRDGAVVGGLLVDTSIPFDGELADRVTEVFTIHEAHMRGEATL